MCNKFKGKKKNPNKQWWFFFMLWENCFHCLGPRVPLEREITVNWSPLTFEEIFISWWEWPLPGWPAHIHREQGLTGWCEEIGNDVNHMLGMLDPPDATQIDHPLESLAVHFSQRAPPLSSNHTLKEYKLFSWLCCGPKHY